MKQLVSWVRDPAEPPPPPPPQPGRPLEADPEWAQGADWRQQFERPAAASAVVAGECSSFPFSAFRCVSTVLIACFLCLSFIDERCCDCRARRVWRRAACAGQHAGPAGPAWSQARRAWCAAAPCVSRSRSRTMRMLWSGAPPYRRSFRCLPLPRVELPCPFDLDGLSWV